MMHEREFEAAEACVEPLPNWAMTLFWFSAFVFCCLFWLGAVKLILISLIYEIAGSRSIPFCGTAGVPSLAGSVPRITLETVFV